MTPAEFVASCLARRWSSDWACYDLVRDFHREVSGIDLPRIGLIPPAARPQIVAETVEQMGWATTSEPVEGAVLTMSKHRSMLKHHHYGVWCLGRCLHVDLLQPVQHDTLRILQVKGWRVDAILIPA